MEKRAAAAADTAIATGDAATAVSAGNTANSEITEGTRAALGPFQLPPGHELVQLPSGSDTQGGWVENCRDKKWWSGKRLAHIFDDEWSPATGGTYQQEEKLHGEWHFCFFYKDLRRLRYSHSLLIEEHGLTKSWVVLKKSK